MNQQVYPAGYDASRLIAALRFRGAIVMCRLFAVRASHSRGYAAELLDSENALICQSRCDYLGRDHSDGWGVAYYRGNEAIVRRSVTAAGSDLNFDFACREAKSGTLVVHVRRASKGVRSPANCHPFVHGRWTFMHNGTITAIEALRESMLSELTLSLRKRVQGQTDSELLFYWLLRRLGQQHAMKGDRCLSLAKMRQVIASSLAELDQRNDACESPRQVAGTAKLNVVLTNGGVMVASRMRNSLFWLQREQLNPGGRDFRACLIASEPIAGEPWQEVDDLSVMSVSSGGVVVHQWIEYP